MSLSLHRFYQTSSPSQSDHTQDDSTEAQDGNEEEKRKSPWSTLSLLLLGVFVSQLDQSLVLATYGQVASEFEELDSASWLMSSYILAQCAIQPLYGKLSDVYSRKSCLLTAYTLFAIGTAGCGLSQSMGQVIASRAVQGAGGAGMVSLVSIIITDIMPKKDIALTRSYVNVLQTMGRSCGGVVGGIVTQAIGWRWAFLVQVPPTMVAIGLVAWGLDLTSKRSEQSGDTLSRVDKLKRIDFIGSFFLGLTILSICLVLDLGGQQLEWSSHWMLAIVAVGVASAIAYTISARIVADPIFPLGLLAKRAVITNYFCILLGLMAQMSLMTFVPIYFQSTANASTAAAGAFLIPAFAGNTVGGLLTGYLIKRTGRYKVFTVLAPVISICCMASLVVTWNGNTTIALSLLIFPGGFAAGMVSSSAFVGLVDGISEEHVAITASGSYLFFNLGAIAGVSVGSASFHSGLRKTLEETLHKYSDKEKVTNYIWN